MTPGRRGRALAMAGCALAVIAVLYLVFVRTGWGQRLDDLAMEGRKATHLGVRRAATRAMSLATRVALPCAGVALAVVAARTRRWRAALGAAAALLLAVLLSRLLKAELPRDDLLERSNVGPENTFPSGHSAAAMALALLAVWLCSAEQRRRMQVVASVAVVLHTLALLGSGWHRPSDVLAGFAVAVVVVALALTLEAPTSDGPPPHAGHRQLDRGQLLSGTAAVMVVSTLGLLVVRGTPNPAHSFAAYLVSVLVAVVAAVLVVHVVTATVAPGARVAPDARQLT